VPTSTIPPYFFTGRMPILPPNQQCQSTEGNYRIWIRENTLEFSMVLPASSLYRPVKIWGDGGGRHWLVRMEWHPAGWSVYLPLLISPCTTESRSSLLALAHPGGPEKRAVKRLWCGIIHMTHVIINKHHLPSELQSSYSVSRPMYTVRQAATRSLCFWAAWTAL